MVSLDKLLSFNFRSDRSEGDPPSAVEIDGSNPPPNPPPHHVVELRDVADGGDAMNEKKISLILSFKDLTYRVRDNKKPPCVLPRTAPSEEEFPSPAKARTKTLLDSISGEAREGEILAVLGASGCGKSTLLDALAGRISRGSLRGDVALNGEPVDGRLLRAISAYVMQDDLLFPMLTVEETLMYAAEFRLPDALPHHRKRARVDALIDQLGLRAAAGTIIGDEGHRGVSGGERRRVSIGIDIVHDPIVLFLDEPTSGLDSTSAFRVVEVLRRIALGGSVVVATIHQPSSRILGLLDRLLLLSRGQSVFSGSPADLHPYFTAFGRPIPDNEGRTEFALDLIRELEGAPCGTKPLVDHCKAWQFTSTPPPPRHTLPLKEAIAASVSRGKLVAGASGGGELRAFANSFWTELGVLTRRSFTNTRRQPQLFAYRLATVLVTGFILATVYWQLDATPRGVSERLGFFAFAMSVMFYTCGDALPVFLHERYVFLRETAHNAYRRSSYVCANALASLPALAVLSVAFAATTFYPVGLAGGVGGLGFFLLMVFASFWAGNSFVTFLSGVVSSVMVGFTVVVATLAYYLLVSGFFIAKDRIPGYWMWFHYLSLVKYPYEAVMRNEFGDAARCFARGAEVFDQTPLAGAAEGVKTATMEALGGAMGVNLTAGTCLLTGPDVLREQGIEGGLSKWGCLLVTVAWGFFFRGLFYVALLVGGRNKRR